MKTFELENEEGLRLHGLEFGATLTSLSLPVAGVRREVLLGCADEDYSAQQVWLGAVAGRFANRIGGAELVRGDERWSLDANQPPHCLHGGRDGFHRRTWQIKEQEADRVKLALLSRAGDQGFPGNLRVSLEYRLEQCDLVVDFCASTDAPSPVSLTSHAYFNLDGHQGGSDVRSNTTRAYPLGAEGPGQAYELVGHKYFVSAPMSDAFLVLAQAPDGLSCFWLPRWRPDGSKNPLQIQRLKNKMGNVANASCETELRGAYAQMVGGEGRGVPTILKMVTMTRFDCMVGSSAGMRQAVAQALHHCAHRSAFGKLLAEQPLMQNVLADLAIESEAALAMTMRIAKALDIGEASAHEKMLVRVGTAVGKYWICKRTPAHAYEAMECIGGSGVMEDCIMPRLFRESPVNSIWEGSGNVQCLDMLRAMGRNPGSVDAYMDEVQAAAGTDRRLDQYVARLGAELLDPSAIEYRARGVVEKMALALQGSLLVRYGNHAVADAFCASRLGEHYSGLTFGALPRGLDCAAIIARATPRM